jgi:L-lactate dehydrogenase
MKIGIVGVGAVGAATAMAIVLRGRVRELVLVNRNRARAKGVATDIRYGVPLLSPITISDGDYSDLSDASVVIVAAGVNEKAGGAIDRNDPAGRLRLLGSNIKIYEEIIPRIVAAAPHAVMLVATDPPEPLVDIVRRFAGHERVIGTGTYLDSLRFRVHLAQRLDVDAASVDAYVVGEHGTSSVFLWSSARVGGMSVEQLIANRGMSFDELRRSVEHDVRYANISIIEGIGASQYGIGIVAARIAEAIARNEQTVFPVGSFVARYGVTLSLPSVVGWIGVSDVLSPEMSDDETRALDRSAERLRAALAAYVELPR